MTRSLPVLAFFLSLALLTACQDNPVGTDTLGADAIPADDARPAPIAVSGSGVH